MGGGGPCDATFPMTTRVMVMVRLVFLFQSPWAGGGGGYNHHERCQHVPLDLKRPLTYRALQHGEHGWCCGAVDWFNAAAGGGGLFLP